MGAQYGGQTCHTERARRWRSTTLVASGRRIRPAARVDARRARPGDAVLYRGRRTRALDRAARHRRKPRRPSAGGHGPFDVSARRFPSVPVGKELDDAVRLAAKSEGLTISAWVRQTFVDATTAHARAGSSATPRKMERAIADLKAIPRACTLGEASAMLDLSRRAIAGKLRTGQIAGYHERRSFYDPGRGKFLRRTWWTIPWPNLGGQHARARPVRTRAPTPAIHAERLRGAPAAEVTCARNGASASFDEEWHRGRGGYRSYATGVADDRDIAFRRCASRGS